MENSGLVCLVEEKSKKFSPINGRANASAKSHRLTAVAKELWL